MLNLFADMMITATVIKADLGTYVDGIWTPTEPDEDDEVSISIIPPQPLTGDMLDMLPEGERVHEYCVTWTEYTAALWSDSDASDTLEIGDEQFKIVTIFDRFRDGGFCKLLLHRITADLAEPNEDEPPPEEPAP